MIEIIIDVVIKNDSCLSASVEIEDKFVSTEAERGSNESNTDNEKHINDHIEFGSTEWLGIPQPPSANVEEKYSAWLKLSYCNQMGNGKEMRKVMEF